jgi:hypothetical protein
MTSAYQISLGHSIKCATGSFVATKNLKSDCGQSVWFDDSPIRYFSLGRAPFFDGSTSFPCLDTIAPRRAQTAREDRPVSTRLHYCCTGGGRIQPLARSAGRRRRSGHSWDDVQLTAVRAASSQDRGRRFRLGFLRSQALDVSRTEWQVLQRNSKYSVSSLASRASTRGELRGTHDKSRK